MKNDLTARLASLMLAAVTIMSTGCSSSDSSKSSSQQETTAVQTTTAKDDSLETTTTTEQTTTTTTTATLMPPMKEPSETLPDFEAEGDLVDMKNGPDQTLLLHTHTYDASTVSVYDIVSGATVRTLQLADDTEMLVGGLSDETIVTLSYADGVQLNFYPKGKSKPQTVSTGEEYLPTFATDAQNNCILWFDPTTYELCSTDTGGKVTKTAVSSEISTASDINTYDRTYSMTEFDENSDSGYSAGIYSLDTNERLIETESSDWNSFLSAEGYIYTTAEPDENSNTAFYLEKTPYDSTARHTRFIIDQSEGIAYLNVMGSLNSSYATLLVNDSTNDTYISRILMLDLKTGKTAEIKPDTTEDIISVLPCYNKDIKRWVYGIITGSFEYPHVHLMMTDPALLSYDKELKSEETEPAKEKVYEVGEKFREVREAADKLEEKYGIRILVGNEVGLSEKTSDYVFVSREDSENPYAVEDELFSLNELDKILGCYPEGFFEHFKTKNGKFGFRLALVDALKNDDYSDFVAGGIAYTSGMWYDIAIQSSMINYTQASFDHEMWHTVENLVSRNDPLDESKWSELNPYDFYYSSDFDSYASSSELNDTMLEYADINEGLDPSLPYFISSYSTVTAMEDRATLIECILSHRYKYDGTDDEPYVFGTEGISSYPHLKAKADFLAEWTKKEFGYVYWEKVEQAMKEYDKKKGN